jgi:hypothetical protein
MVLGYILGDFFTNKSGHPGHSVDFLSLSQKTVSAFSMGLPALPAKCLLLKIESGKTFQNFPHSKVPTKALKKKTLAAHFDLDKLRFVSTIKH